METWTVRNHQTDLFSHRPQLVMQQQKMTWETASPSSVKTVLAWVWSGRHQAKPSLLRSRAYHAATGVPASMVGCSWLPKYLYLDVHLCKYICLKHSIYRLFYTDVNWKLSSDVQIMWYSVTTSHIIEQWMERRFCLFESRQFTRNVSTIVLQ